MNRYARLAAIPFAVALQATLVFGPFALALLVLGLADEWPMHALYWFAGVNAFLALIWAYAREFSL